MDVLVFDSIIVAKSLSGTEQIGRTDYRFELIKSAKSEDRPDIVQHKWINKFSKDLHFRDGTIYYNDTEVPAEIISASLVNYNDQSRFSAYLNGWITNFKAGKNTDISKMYPFFMDGTFFIKENVDFGRMINRYWPDITSGVRKKLIKILKESNVIKYHLFIVSVFDLDPNNSMKMLDYVNELECGSINYDDLEFLLKFKGSRIHKLLNIKNYNNFVKLLKGDYTWYGHLMSIYDSTELIWDFNPSTKLEIFYPLNDMVSYCNRYKSRIGKYKAIFSKYVHMFEFFDGINVAGLVVRIPKDSVDLSDWGYDLKLCVGDPRYIRICAECIGKELLFMLEKDGRPYIMAHVSKTDCVQIMFRENKEVLETDPDLFREILKVGMSILNQDIDSLRPYITTAHLNKKADMYKEKGWLGTNNKALSGLVGKTLANFGQEVTA